MGSRDTPISTAILRVIWTWLHNLLALALTLKWKVRTPSVVAQLVEGMCGCVIGWVRIPPKWKTVNRWVNLPIYFPTIPFALVSRLSSKTSLFSSFCNALFPKQTAVTPGTNTFTPFNLSSWHPWFTSGARHSSAIQTVKEPQARGNIIGTIDLC